MKAISAALAFCVVSGASLLPLDIPATAAADSVCTGDYSIVIGGLRIGIAGTWQNSDYMHGDERIQYDSARPEASGIPALDAAIQAHRAACPDGHIRVLAHSGGALVAHLWIEQHQDFTNANAVLLADPKHSAGLMTNPGPLLWDVAIGPDTGGADLNFGDFPVLEICNHDDGVCNSAAGWCGYLFLGAHQRYDFDAADYDDTSTGEIYG